MAHVRWAVIACQQAARHVCSGEESLELALTAHVVPELELEVLRLTGAGEGEAATATTGPRFPQLPSVDTFRGPFGPCARHAQPSSMCPPVLVK